MSCLWFGIFKFVIFSNDINTMNKSFACSEILQKKNLTSGSARPDELLQPMLAAISFLRGLALAED